MQVLPVKEIGKILYKGLITEERSEMDICEDDIQPEKPKKDSDPYRPEVYSLVVVQLSSAMANLVVHTSEGIPKFHVNDIVTPPPNSHSA